MSQMEQRLNFFDSVFEKARACNLAIKESIKLWLKSVILEGDCLAPITKLKNKDV